MVQSEYGWRDDEVLDLTVARLRLIIDQVKDRRLMEFKNKARMMEWQTRTLAQFIAATTGAEGKALQTEAGKVSLAIDGADTEGSADGSIEEYDYIEHGSATALSRNSVGTAERLMGGFGQG